MASLRSRQGGARTTYERDCRGAIPQRRSPAPRDGYLEIHIREWIPDGAAEAAAHAQARAPEGLVVASELPSSSASAGSRLTRRTRRSEGELSSGAWKCLRARRCNAGLRQRVLGAHIRLRARAARRRIKSACMLVGTGMGKGDGRGSGPLVGTLARPLRSQVQWHGRLVGSTRTCLGGHGYTRAGKWEWQRQ